MAEHFNLQKANWGVFVKNNNKLTCLENIPSAACYAGMGYCPGELLVSCFRTSLDPIIWHTMAMEIMPEVVLSGVQFIHNRGQLPEETREFARKAAMQLGTIGEDDDEDEAVLKGDFVARNFYVTIDLTKMSWNDVFLVLNWYRMLQEKAHFAEPIINLWSAGVPINMAIAYASFAIGEASSGHHTFGYYYALDALKGKPPNYKDNWEQRIKRNVCADKDSGGCQGIRFAATIGQIYDPSKDIMHITFDKQPQYLFVPILGPGIKRTRVAPPLLEALEGMIPGLAFTSTDKAAA